ncbi:Hypothetical predicted protein [Octopus vulgaris]|uniref:Uncharacterized protein n=1 Tax=Octopus vulgaris TaxID=6645 RepID=A0AA36BBN8_OCTVU|nr:Hypothetical predicted protein [Octopus vulgaris]
MLNSNDYTLLFHMQWLFTLLLVNAMLCLRSFLFQTLCTAFRAMKLDDSTDSKSVVTSLLDIDNRSIARINTLLVFSEMSGESYGKKIKQKQTKKRKKNTTKKRPLLPMDVGRFETHSFDN